MGELSTMLKLSQNKIDFCGKERNFKRCSNKDLRDANKDIEDIQKDIKDKMEKGMKMGEEGRTLRIKANELLSKKKPTAKEKKEAEKLNKEADEVQKALEEYGEIIENEQESFDENIVKAYDKICVTLLEPMEPGEFEENHDSRDMIIAKNLSLFYDMYMTGFSQAKIDMRIRQLVDAEHESRFRFQEEE